MQSSLFELNVMLKNEKCYRHIFTAYILLAVKMDCGLLGPFAIQMTSIYLLSRSIMKKLVLAGASAVSMVGTTSSAQGTLGASSLVNMLPLVAIVATVGLASSSGT